MPELFCRQEILVMGDSAMYNETINFVEMRDICKHFGGVQALNKVSFSAGKGEVHALMGENGAGKSTLMKILSGAHLKNSGEIKLDNEVVDINSPRCSHENGISIIYQEFTLARDLTVAENIFIDNLGKGRSIIDWKTLNAEAAKLLNKLGFNDINVSRPVSELSVGYQQVVEICKALSRDSKVIIFDEPTAVLTVNEVTKLFEIINTLKKHGVCIIYISHRLEEIFEICDRITVLKDGGYVDTVSVKDTTNNALVRMMIGRDLKEFFPPRNVKIGETVLSVNNLSAGKAVRDVSFELRKGEVLGFNGLVGAGRTETMRAIFGADRIDCGEIYLRNKLVKIKSPKEAVKMGLGMLPEDRKNQGVLLEQSVRVNASLSFLNRISNSFGFIDGKKEKEIVNDLMKKLSVKAESIDIETSSLSGGNQQKVSLMKWLGSGCDILILDEPTRGVDVGAKIEIYKVINKLAEEGVAIIMISSELPEVIGMSDRAIIMRQGVVMGECAEDTLTEHGCIELAMGVNV